MSTRKRTSRGGVFVGLWLVACGSSASAPPAERAPPAPVLDPAQATSEHQDDRTEDGGDAGRAASSTPADCERRCLQTTEGCGSWGDRGDRCAPPNTCGPPSFAACEPVCCGPDRLLRLAPAELSFDVVVRASEQPGASLTMTVLGGADIAPECPSPGPAWVPERGTGREIASCPAGRVRLGGVVSALVVVVTRWREQPENAYAELRLVPAPESGPDWLERMVEVLAARVEPPEHEVLPPSELPGHAVGGRIRAYPTRPPDAPSVRFAPPPSRGLRR